MITIRKMDPSELSLIEEIDRSEEISQDYVCLDGTLHLKNVHWSVHRWARDGKGEHSVAGKIAIWQPWLTEGGTMFGALDGEILVGFAIYRPDIVEGMGQFAILHVSRSYRRKGLGVALAAKVIELARANGEKTLYVSSTPTKGTVEFYRSLGFRPAKEINRELFELEPEDIHMTMDL